MNEQFRKELEASGYIHTMLPLHPERSLEVALEKQEVIDRRVIWHNGEGMFPTYRGGIGEMTISDGGRKGGKSIHMTAPTEHLYHTYDGGGPDYSASVVFTFPDENLEQYNRLSFWIKVESPGNREPLGIVHLKTSAIDPSTGRPFGDTLHHCNFVNHKWNHIIWQFPTIPKNEVQELSVQLVASGHDTSTGDRWDYDLDDIELQTVAEPEMELGWNVAKGHISYSMSGYWSNGSKTAIADAGVERFEILNAKKEVVYTGKASNPDNTIGTFSVLDFSDLTAPGMYAIKAGGITTSLFEIGPKVMETALWKVLNFVFGQRCGYPVPHKHGTCHVDVVSTHNGVVRPYNGGWHDAGDMSQQTVQTAEVTQELFELAGRVKEKGDDPILYQRLMEEALWGLEFTLRSRLGDGYRATSVGIGHWSNCFIGDSDDIPVRVHKQAYQNFICAAIEAHAARALRDYDPELSWKCGEIAKEDYRFAADRYAEYGIEHPIRYEHTLLSGPSQYYAAIAWAAALIYDVTGEESFIAEAEKYGEKLVNCQDTGESGIGIKGFFYRDETKKEIVHYVHQSREHSFVQAFEALCRVFPESPNRSKWENAMKRYGQYIKDIMYVCAPYGMAPSGIYAETELNYPDTFDIIHGSDFEYAKPHYIEQLKNGVALGNGYYIRRFPVWFGFGGNAAVQLSTGKGAGIVGRYFGDNELLDIAREQLYWIAGKNPFCQSMMNGEGERYAPLNMLFHGESVGALPVGIKTFGDGDIPYWPYCSNYTYKEPWVTTAGRWFAVLADLYPGA